MDLTKLEKLKEVILEKGIYESIKALLDTPFMRDMVMKQVEGIWLKFKDNYEVIAERVQMTGEDGSKKVVVDFYIDDLEKRNLLKERLLNTIVAAKDNTIVKAFIDEFEIKKIKCEVKDTSVRLSFLANEKFAELVRKIGGGVVEES